MASVQWWGVRTTCLQKVKQSVFTLIPIDDSLSILPAIMTQYYTHSLRLLLTQLAAFSLYNLDPNGLVILITDEC